MRSLFAFLVAMLPVLMLGSAHATLIDRGGGLLYDDVLDVTWLQDANYAKTSGFSNGIFTHSQASRWAEDLIYRDSVRNIDLDDWRLPHVSPIGASFDYDFSTDGTTDWGPNNRSPKNELSYMYFVNLGLMSFMNTDGTFNSDFGIFGNGNDAGQNDITVGAVTIFNLQASSYWTDTRWEVPAAGFYYWTFFVRYGETNAAHEDVSQSAWAVRDGDVASPIPEPTTLTLMALGIVGIGYARRRSPRKFAEAIH